MILEHKTFLPLKTSSELILVLTTSLNDQDLVCQLVQYSICIVYTEQLFIARVEPYFERSCYCYILFPRWGGRRNFHSSSIEFFTFSRNAQRKSFVSLFFSFCIISFFFFHTQIFRSLPLNFVIIISKR